MSPFLSNTQLSKAKKIRLLVLDVDGVLSDGRLIFDNNGLETKAFNVKDGLGIKLLASQGIATAIITGRSSHIVANRAASLGIEHVIQGREDKGRALQGLCDALGIDMTQCAYMGDDWPDLSALMQVGFSAAPKNAHPEVIKRVDFVSDLGGGMGAARQLCDALLMAQNLYDDALAGYLSTTGQADLSQF